MPLEKRAIISDVFRSNGRKVEMVEFAEDLLMLLTNIFKPAQVVRYACDDQSKR